jgi:hypothetical protein
VRERSGSAAYELTDAAPSASTPNSLWVPYFAPDEPDSGSYNNNYLSDGSYGSPACVIAPPSGASNSTKQAYQRQCYAGKYKTASASGPSFSCPPAPITPMTNVQGTIDDAIDALVAKGNTVIPAGLLWGWRVISPTAPFTEGAAYSDEKWVKAIVLLTDGENDVSGGSNGIDKSVYGAFGYAKNGHMGNTSGSNAESTLDSKTLAVCSAIKSAGTPDNPVMLYTIGFQVTSASQTLLKSCATKPDMFYNSPTNDQLAGIFQDIAQGLGDLRIAQ